MRYVLKVSWKNRKPDLPKWELMFEGSYDDCQRELTRLMEARVEHRQDVILKEGKDWVTTAKGHWHIFERR